MSWTRNSMDEDADGWYDDDEDDIEATKGNEMKTPEEIIRLYPGLTGLKLNDIEQASLEMAMKEYAKQWVDRALENSFDIDNFNRGIIYKDLENVKNEIDAQ